jgi:iron complex outermembrane receptor protein
VKYNAWQSNTGFFTSISPFVNFTYSDFNYKDFRFQKIVNVPVGTPPINTPTTVTEEYSNQQVAGVAKNMFNAGFDLMTLPGIYANAYYSYKDPVFITSTNTLKTKSYSLLNAKLGYRESFGKHFDLDAYFGVNNITEEKYYLMVFINQIPDAYLPAAKHAVYYGGLNVKYNF